MLEVSEPRVVVVDPDARVKANSGRVAAQFWVCVR